MKKIFYKSLLHVTLLIGTLSFGQIVRATEPYQGIEDCTALDAPANRTTQFLLDVHDINVVGSVADSNIYGAFQSVSYNALKPTVQKFFKFLEVSDACAEVGSNFGTLIVYHKHYFPIVFFTVISYGYQHGHIINSCLRDTYQGLLRVHQTDFGNYVNRLNSKFLNQLTTEHSWKNIKNVLGDGGNYALEWFTPEEYYNTWDRLTSTRLSDVWECVVWTSSWANPFSWWQWFTTVFSEETQAISPINNKKGFVWDVGVFSKKVVYQGYKMGKVVVSWCLPWVSPKAWSRWLGEVAGEFSVGYSSVQTHEETSQEKQE